MQVDHKKYNQIIFVGAWLCETLIPDPHHLLLQIIVVFQLCPTLSPNVGLWTWSDTCQTCDWRTPRILCSFFCTFTIINILVSRNPAGLVWIKVLCTFFVSSSSFHRPLQEILLRLFGVIVTICSQLSSLSKKATSESRPGVTCSIFKPDNVEQALFASKFWFRVRIHWLSESHLPVLWFSYRFYLLSSSPRVGMWCKSQDESNRNP